MNVLQKAKRKGLLKSKDHSTCLDPRSQAGGIRMARCNVGKLHGDGNTQIFYLSENSELVLNSHNGDIDYW
jgi:hypothetical protein